MRRKMIKHISRPQSVALPEPKKDLTIGVGFTALICSLAFAAGFSLGKYLDKRNSGW